MKNSRKANFEGVTLNRNTVETPKPAETRTANQDFDYLPQQDNNTYANEPIIDYSQPNKVVNSFDIICFIKKNWLVLITIFLLLRKN